MSPSLQVSDDLDEPDVYDSPSSTPPVSAGQECQASVRVEEFAADVKRSLEALDDDLAHGNVLAARGAVLVLKMQLSLLVKALQR